MIFLMFGHQQYAVVPDTTLTMSAVVIYISSARSVCKSSYS